MPKHDYWCTACDKELSIGEEYFQEQQWSMDVDENGVGGVVGVTHRACRPCAEKHFPEWVRDKVHWYRPAPR